MSGTSASVTPGFEQALAGLPDGYVEGGLQEREQTFDWQCVRVDCLVAGGDDDLDRRPAISNGRGEFQSVHAARLVAALRERDPDLFYACDPVIGDPGGLYVPEPMAEAIRDHLIPLASLAIPNRYELAWLSGAPLDDNNAVMEAALALGPSRMLVTSAVPMMAGGTGNLYLSGRNALLAEHRSIDNAPNGLGDLLSAIFLSRLLSGLDEERALQLATASVYEVLARAVKRGSDELTLAADASSLSTPMAMVQMSRLMHPSQRRQIAFISQCGS